MPSGAKNGLPDPTWGRPTLSGAEKGHLGHLEPIRTTSARLASLFKDKSPSYLRTESSRALVLRARQEKSSCVAAAINNDSCVHCPALASSGCNHTTMGKRKSCPSDRMVSELEGCACTWLNEYQGLGSSTGQSISRCFQNVTEVSLVELLHLHPNSDGEMLQVDMRLASCQCSVHKNLGFGQIPTRGRQTKFLWIMVATCDPGFQATGS